MADKGVKRESSFELLRIISMFMVLILHADFQALGAPTYNEIVSTSFTSVIKVFFEIASIVAVNVFVLISGYFGIRPSVKGFSKFIFQCFFFSIGIYVVMILLGLAEFSLNGLVNCLALTPGTSYWFILSYVCLYLFAPVLNSFINSADKKQFIYLLLCFYIFQTLCGFVTSGASFFMRGYSAPSFMGLYLLAAFVKRHIDIKIFRRQIFAKGYILITILLSIIWLFAAYMDYTFLKTRLLNYSNPLVIIASLCLLLYFSKISFKSDVVNKIAASSFAVYLLHCHPFIYPYYLISISNLNHQNVLIEFCLIIGAVCLWFLFAVLVDFMRIFVWNRFIEVRYAARIPS